MLVVRTVSCWVATCAGYFSHPLTTLDIFLEIFPCLSPCGRARGRENRTHSPVSVQKTSLLRSLDIFSLRSERIASFSPTRSDDHYPTDCATCTTFRHRDSPQLVMIAVKPEQIEDDRLNSLKISSRYCHSIWWIIQSASANTLRAGCCVMRQSGQATSSWNEALSDFSCWHLHRPFHDLPLQTQLASGALKRGPAAMGKRAPRARSIVGWFSRLPSASVRWRSRCAPSLPPRSRGCTSATRSAMWGRTP
jgi:hypothetical protein